MTTQQIIAELNRHHAAMGNLLEMLNEGKKVKALTIKQTVREKTEARFLRHKRNIEKQLKKQANVG